MLTGLTDQVQLAPYFAAAVAAWLVIPILALLYGLSEALYETC